MPQLSIIIPIYNAEKTIAKTLDSVLRSTLEDIEVICVDDGSVDGSNKIIDAYALMDSRVKAIHSSNGGVSRARNIGIASAASEYIAFVDADDTISEDMYQKMLTYLINNDLDCVECGINKLYKRRTTSRCIVSEDTIVNGYSRILSDIIKPLLGRSSSEIKTAASSVNKIFKRDIIEACSLRFNEKRTKAEDWQFVIEYYRRCSKVGILKVPYYNYIRYSSDTAINRYSEWYENSLEDRIRFSDLFPELDWESNIADFMLLPISAVANIRTFFSGDVADEKMKRIFSLTKRFHVFEKDIPHDCPNKQRTLIESIKNAVLTDDYKKFKQITYKESTRGVLIARCKNFAKKFIMR